MTSMGRSFSIRGRVLEVTRGTITSAEVVVRDGQIVEMRPTDETSGPIIAPCFVDAHVHLESSKVHPAHFERAAVVWGTGATVSDPHEIANVLGVAGVEYMIEAVRALALRVALGVPSCVPASHLETSGATLGPDAVDGLLEQLPFLAEVMAFPAVLGGDPGVLAKIASAKRRGKPVDGHAPGLRGEDAARYAAAGISTDHECTTLEEALDKIAAGMKILIREGSAAKNLKALLPLFFKFPDALMLCTDDLEPYDLVRGHINLLVRRVIAAGVDPIVAWRAASLTPVMHYGLELGLLRVGDPADFMLLDDLESVVPTATYLRGELVAQDGKCLLPQPPPPAIVNRFECRPIDTGALAVRARGERMRLIVIHDGQLVTSEGAVTPTVRDGMVVSDPARDVLKLAVVNRYAEAPPALGFVSGFGLRRGALASSVAHDSHNIVAVGATDDELRRAINAVIEARGGIAFVDGDNVRLLPLPIAGLMSDRSAPEVAESLTSINDAVRAAGCPLTAAFMTLSFLALSVIPSLKLSDKGLVDPVDAKTVDLFL